MPAARATPRSRRVGDTAFRRSETSLQRLAEAARLDEVPLHVDDDESDCARIEFEIVWLGANYCHQLFLMALGPSLLR